MVYKVFHRSGSILTLLLSAGPLFAAPSVPTLKRTTYDPRVLGHSSHGEAFDIGPRQKPWMMEGIGKSHFPVTTSNPEAQVWFDQGNTLLHSFWYYEAERSFRWVLKLDPDCAMAYWGLARSVGETSDRASTFIKEAAKRKSKVSEREKLYIEAWEALVPTDLPKEAGGNDDSYDKRRARHRELLEKIVLRYPDDVEAKALLWRAQSYPTSPYLNELLLRQVLAREPNHPGAHHYRIHNWEGEEAAQALDSCARFVKIAPRIGHALHMPGHTYSTLGMWNEAAISMDSATRVEKEYMRRRLAFPFNSWNYAHNQNYLCYIQEQLGMADAALSGARQLLAAPRDPQGGEFSQGMEALTRALLRFERWNDLLDSETLVWGDGLKDRMNRAYYETRAHLGLGDLDKAAKSYRTLLGLRAEVEKPENQWLKKLYTVETQELEGMLNLAKGDTIRGLSALSEAARSDAEDRRNDPPDQALRYVTLGRAYLDHQSPALAVTAYEKALGVTRNDGFALAGLVEAYKALGQEEKARDAYARLLYVWSDADPGLRPFDRVKALGLTAESRDDAPGVQRSYKRVTLDPLGPTVWEPYEAPTLDAVDSQGRRVSLKEFRGRNVLLIFYLSEECPHCMEQLAGVKKLKDDLDTLNTDVLTVSGSPPDKIAQFEKRGFLPFRLLSDPDLQNARRFNAYDDFEDLALHATILIDKRGRVYWARAGGDAFMDFDFLLKEIKRMNGLTIVTDAK
jgi:peroxiredoxin